MHSISGLVANKIFQRAKCPPEGLTAVRYINSHICDTYFDVRIHRRADSYNSNLPPIGRVQLMQLSDIDRKPSRRSSCRLGDSPIRFDANAVRPSVRPKRHQRLHEPPGGDARGCVQSHRGALTAATDFCLRNAADSAFARSLE